MILRSFIVAHRRSVFGFQRRIGHGFSLLELMIAIVVLGLGMVMVATMFPLAIGRARRLSEYTKQTSITEAAQTTVRLLGQVDGLDYDISSFAGDLVFDPAPPDNPQRSALITYADTRVHYLHMENVTVEGERSFVPDRLAPWDDPFAPWRLDWPDFFSADTFINSPDDVAGFCDPLNPAKRTSFCYSSFLSARVRFESRVYPPMRSRKNVSPAGEFDVGDGTSLEDADTVWDDTLNTRRFGWAVLHRLKRIVGPRRPGFDDASLHPAARTDAAGGVNLAREFDMFYVTLRRPQSTLRYARQEPTSAPNINENLTPPYPYVLMDEPQAVPVAAGPENDVLFPEAWRVQVEFPDGLPTTDPNETDPERQPTGVPTVIEVPPRDMNASPAELYMLTSMFQRGTQFIDELTGRVYRVVRMRLAPAEDRAFLTLDREVTLEDLDVLTHPDDIAEFPPCLGCEDGVLDINERLRTVWVFPPPVVPERISNGVPIFEGPQPVVGIEVRPLTVTPRS